MQEETKRTQLNAPEGPGLARQEASEASGSSTSASEEEEEERMVLRRARLAPVVPLRREGGCMGMHGGSWGCMEAHGGSWGVVS